MTTPEVVKHLSEDFARRFNELGYAENGPCVADGSGQELSAAGWLYYEGLDGTFGEERLDQQVPVMVMNVLVHRHGFTWSSAHSHDASKLQVTHRDLAYPVDRERLVQLGRAALAEDRDLQDMPDAVAAIEGIGALITEITNRQVDRNRGTW